MSPPPARFALTNGLERCQRVTWNCRGSSSGPQNRPQSEGTKRNRTSLYAANLPSVSSCLLNCWHANGLFEKSTRIAKLTPPLSAEAGKAPDPPGPFCVSVLRISQRHRPEPSRFVQPDPASHAKGNAKCDAKFCYGLTDRRRTLASATSRGSQGCARAAALRRTGPCCSPPSTGSSPEQRGTDRQLSGLRVQSCVIADRAGRIRRADEPEQAAGWRTRSPQPGRRGTSLPAHTPRVTRPRRCPRHRGRSSTRRPRAG